MAREPSAGGCGDGATWLRTTEAGDDKDRVLIKADGDFTYLTPDIAYHRDKFSRSDLLINVWGADHHGYIRRMKAAMEFLGNDPDALEVIVTQLVSLERDGVEVQMSGRLGDMVSLDEVIDEVGPLHLPDPVDRHQAEGRSDRTCDEEHGEPRALRAVRDGTY